MDTTTAPAARSAHRDDAAVARLVVLTKVVAACHVLVGLAGVLYATVLLVEQAAAEGYDDPLAGLGLGFAVPLLVVGGPMLVLATASLFARRPGWVHGLAVAAGVATLLAQAALSASWFGVFLAASFDLVGVPQVVRLVPLLLVGVGVVGLIAGRRR